MKIRHSSNEEISIEGSLKEMENLSNELKEFVCSKNVVLKVSLLSDYDPQPYDEAIETFHCLKNDENKIEVKNKILYFSGSNEFFESVASNLPYGNIKTPYHIHYDSISFPEFIQPEAPEIVFEATH